jgi:hypothetical protein
LSDKSWYYPLVTFSEPTHKTVDEPPVAVPQTPTTSGEESYEFPCSLAQRTCWYLDRMAPGSATYNIAVRFLLTGPLKIGLLEETLRCICVRHEILRTRFVAMDEEPMQVVEPHPNFSLPVVDLRALPAAEREALEFGVEPDRAYAHTVRGELIALLAMRRCC